MTLVGAGFRPELPGVLGLGGQPPLVDCVELIADRYFGDGHDKFARAWELHQVRELPTLLHGLSGNAASWRGPSKDYLGQIGALAGATDAVAYSDHLALTGTADRALGHLAPNRFDAELLDAAAGHVRLMAEVTGRRVCLENLATNITISGSTWTPEEFYLRLLEASDGWDCLLDLTNVWINAQSRDLDPVAFVDAIPADRIGYVHLAGGERIDGALVDSHSQAVHAEVFELLEHLLERTAPPVIIIERDSNWAGADEEVRADLARVRDLLARRSAASGQAVAS